ncbi:MAG: M15 family metallopeptidase [Boseongicola sp. SB0673_bin_14]|nr:M15 family metallopeptidase [Boseongicola sp. SB0673_bin_14]
MINETLWDQWYQLLIYQWGLDYRFAFIVSAVQAALETYGFEPVTITSGYRSPERQRQLQAAWDANNRTGLVARPATRSWHMQGLAVDVSTSSENFNLFREIMESIPNVRWGGRFTTPDRVHFDYPGGKLKSIDQLLAT